MTDSSQPRWAPEALHRVLRVLLPILLALGAGAVLLVILGKDPLAYYGYVLKRGLYSPSGFEASITRMAPLLLIAAGLIVAFRAGLWNLGVDGQFLLAAVFVSALTPALLPFMPAIAAIVLAFLVAVAVGAAWSLIPAFLKARHGINEIISTLMMSFLGVSFANVLIKIPFNDPSTTVPQTATLPVDDRLARLGDSTVHWGVVLAVIMVVAVHYLMERTSLGLKLQIVGTNPRTAIHCGLDVKRLTFVAFAISAGLAGLAGAVDVLGVHGTIRADWNPAYGIVVIPLVFLARFNGFAVIAFVFFFAVLMIGGESAARRLGVPSFFVLVLVALLMLFFAVIEFLDHARRNRAGS
ncbi:MAG: ABC transporter permease [Pseudomonadota bacterium]